MPNEFWAQADALTAYLENITPLASKKLLTPHKLWYGQTPKYDHFHAFGYLAYIHIGQELRRGKFANTARRGVMLGYQEVHHGYRIWLL